MTPEPHERLSAAMDIRRTELGLSWREVAEAAGITVTTLNALRKGQNEPSALTKRGIENALSWEAGSIAATLNGGTPTVRGQRVPLGTAEEAAEAQPLGRRKTRRLGLDVPADEELRAMAFEPETVEALIAMRERVRRLVKERNQAAIRRANRILEALDEEQDAG